MHNIKLQPYQSTKITYTLIFLSYFLTLILASQIITQPPYIAKSIKSIKLPLKVINGVPYLQLRKLCSGIIIQQISSNFINFWPNQQQPQFEDLVNFNKQADVVVLLDTGSSDFWLADHSCSTCTYTKSLCPHLATSQRKISYVKGYIEGVDSYINLCDNRIKFLCVKSNNGVGQIQGEGILGIREGSTGLMMLFNILKKKQPSITINDPKYNPNKNKQQYTSKNIQHNKYQYIQSMSLQFSLQKYINNLHLTNKKQIRHKNNKNKIQQYIQIKCDKDWSFWVDHISLFNQQIIIKSKLIQQVKNNKSIKIYIDTGSTKLIFSYGICINFIQQMLSIYNIRCVYQIDQGIDCNRIIKDINFKIIIINKFGNQQILSINQNNLINQVNNRLNILCQSQSITPQPLTLVLGYPFLRSYLTIFNIQIRHILNQAHLITNNKQINYYVKINKQNNQKTQQYNFKIVMVFYLIAVLLSGWGWILLLDFIKDKRSKKIII